MSNTRTLIALAAGLALSLGGTTMAAASPSTDGSEQRVVVRYSAAELASDEGLQRVQRRILAAVKQACPSAPIRDLEKLVPVEACRAQALAHAAAQVKSPRLAAVLAVSAPQG